LTVYSTADSGILRALKADTGQLRWQGHILAHEGGTYCCTSSLQKNAPC